MADCKDYRVNHIKNITLKLLNASYSQWAEVISNEEKLAVMKDFLETPSTTFLLISLDQNGKLLMTLEFPSARHIYQKIAYFLKNNSPVSSENVKREIMFGIVCNSPLNQYEELFEMVLNPIFSHSSNNNRWPAEITNNIFLHFQDFKKILTYHVGVAQSKTVLVIPEIAKSIENYNVNEMFRDQIDYTLCKIINAITDMICDWILVIKEVLSITYENILLKLKQGPSSELQFWKNHKENLEFIQEQLSDPLIEKIICVLEKTDNIHYLLFRNLLQDVVEAVTEVNEINESLSAMSDQLKNLEACEFTKIKEILFEVVKIMTSSWTNSKYFSKVPSRISVLIQKFCFLMLEKVEEYLKPSESFKGEVFLMKNKVEICIETLNIFLQSYTDCQESYKQDNKLYPWIFPDDRVFSSLKNFLERLNKVREIFKASVLYCSIPDYKIYGVSQIRFKIRLDKLYELFSEHYQVFLESTYNPLDLKSDEFLEDYSFFSTKVAVLDHKLGTALSQTCLSCVTSEDSLKFMKLVENLLERPQVNLEFRKQMTLLYRNIYMKLFTAKDTYDNSLILFKSDNQIIYKNLPTVSGQLQWSLDLQKKLSFPINLLQHIQQYYIKGDHAELIFRTYNEMKKLLCKFQVEIFSTWERTLQLVKEQLTEPLFSGYEQNLLLNFALQIFDTAQVIQYVNMVEKTDLLPSDAVVLCDSIQPVLLSHFLLACALQWYNNLTQNLMDFEIMLIKDEWDNVCQDLKTGFNEKWSKTDLKDYSEDVYKIIKSLYEKINQARKNVREVEKFIETWNKLPVFVREKPDSIVNFEMFMTPKMHQQIYNVIETSINMNRVMEENMQLFGCDPESDKWRNYVLYLDSIIEASLKESIQCSLQYLAENTNRFNMKLAPFYKIRMVLEEDITFVPSLNQNQLGSFFILFNAVIERIYAPASEIRRLANPEMDYSEAVVEDCDLNSLKDQVIQHIEFGINNILDHSGNYQLYSDIWLQDIDSVLEDFLLYGPLQEAKSEETEIQVADEPLEIKTITEEEFRAEINQFDMLQKKIEEIPDEILIESWLILDIVSFKESLLSLIRRWSTTYEKKLVELKSQGELQKDEYNGD